VEHVLLIVISAAMLLYVQVVRILMDLPLHLHAKDVLRFIRVVELVSMEHACLVPLEITLIAALVVFLVLRIVRLVPMELNAQAVVNQVQLLIQQLDYVMEHLAIISLIIV